MGSIPRIKKQKEKEEEEEEKNMVHKVFINLKEIYLVITYYVPTTYSNLYPQVLLKSVLGKMLN